LTRGGDRGYNIDIFLNNIILPQIKKLQISHYIRSIAATPAKGNPPLKKGRFFHKTLQNFTKVNIIPGLRTQVGGNKERGGEGRGGEGRLVVI